MNRTHVLIAVAWVLSLVGAGAGVYAQARGVVTLPTPQVLSGSDVGFRVEGIMGDTPVGRLVVRVNGNWVPVMEAGGQALLGDR
jgi:hypothetical protein